VAAGEHEGYQPSRSGATTNVGDIERLLSVAAGAGLAGLAVARRGWGGLALGAVGAGLLWRGITGRCPCYALLGIDTAETEHSGAIGVPAQQGYKLQRTITIDRPAPEIYQFWRRLENLPRVMRHLKNVQSLDHERSHWVAEGALGKEVQWDAEIHNERENELIAWRSLPGGDVDTAGSVHFQSLGHNGRTQLTLSMKYNPPAGKIGAQLASLFGEGLEEKLDEDLRCFKQFMETGMPPAPAETRGESPLHGQYT
jgi:uncharacterized membrane protein